MWLIKRLGRFSITFFHINFELLSSEPAWLELTKNKNELKVIAMKKHEILIKVIIISRVSWVIKVTRAVAVIRVIRVARVIRVIRSLSLLV